jgi:hypothetical protein
MGAVGASIARLINEEDESPWCVKKSDPGSWNVGVNPYFELIFSVRPRVRLIPKEA